MSDLIKPVEWTKSFTGDGLPDGPNVDYHTGLKLSWEWYNGEVDKFMQYHQEYGKIFTMRMFGIKPIWLLGAEANQKMYVDNWRDFYWWGEAINGHLAGLIGNGLLASVDEKHDRARRLLEPVFSNTNLEKYVEKMTTHVEQSVQKIEDGNDFDFYELSHRLALENATICFMGMDLENRKIKQLHKHFATCSGFYQKPLITQFLRGPLTPHSKFKQSRQKLSKILYSEIDNRRQNGPKQQDNIMDRLLEAGEGDDGFSDDEIYDQLLNLYWAGHDTTSSAIAWLIKTIGEHPDVYKKVRNEIDERVGNSPITLDEVTNGLPYLDLVIDETLRLYPPAWIAFRKSRKSFSIYGHDIPKDHELMFSSYITHRMPEYYDDPLMFKPKRMEPENKRNFPSGAYIPFGRGPRTCIGMNFAKYEIKLVAATFLRHFDYELKPGQSFQPYPVATLTPAEGVKITPHQRNRTQIRPSTTNKPDNNGSGNDKAGQSHKSGDISDCPVMGDNEGGTKEPENTSVTDGKDKKQEKTTGPASSSGYDGVYETPCCGTKVDPEAGFRLITCCSEEHTMDDLVPSQDT